MLGKPKAGDRPAAAPRSGAVRVRLHVAEPVGQHDSVRLVEQPPAPVTTRQRPRPAAPDRRGAPTRGAGATPATHGTASTPAAPSGRPVAGRRPAPVEGVPAARVLPPAAPATAAPRAARRLRATAARRGRRARLRAVAVRRRLVQLQGLDAPAYAAEAEAGRLRTVTLPAVRGTITDRNGVALATTVAAVNVTADQTRSWTPRPPRRCSPRCSASTPPVLQREADRHAPVRLRRQGGRPRRPGGRSGRSTYPDPTTGPARHLRRADQQARLPRRPGRRPTSSASSAPTARASAASSTRWTRRSPAATAPRPTSCRRRRPPHPERRRHRAGRRRPAPTSGSTIDRDIQWVAQKAIAKAVGDAQRAERHGHRHGPAGPVSCSPWRPRRPSTRTTPGAAPADDRGNRAADRGLRARQHRQGHHGRGAASRRAWSRRPRRSRCRTGSTARGKSLQGLRGRTAPST